GAPWPRRGRSLPARLRLAARAGTATWRDRRRAWCRERCGLRGCGPQRDARRRLPWRSRRRGARRRAAEHESWLARLSLAEDPDRHHRWPRVAVPPRAPPALRAGPDRRRCFRASLRRERCRTDRSQRPARRPSVPNRAARGRWPRRRERSTPPRSGAAGQPSVAATRARPRRSGLPTPRSSLARELPTVHRREAGSTLFPRRWRLAREEQHPTRHLRPPRKARAPTSPVRCARSSSRSGAFQASPQDRACALLPNPRAPFPPAIPAPAAPENQAPAPDDTWTTAPAE